MAFTFTNYAALPTQGDPFVKNLMESLIQGYKIGQAPFEMQRQAEYQRAQTEAEKQRALMDQMKMQFMPEEQRLKQALLEAKTQSTLNPASRFEKELAGVKRIEQMYGKDSEEFKQASSNLQRYIQGSQTSLTVDPATGAISFSQGRGTGNQPNQMIVGDEVISKPTTPTTTAQQKRNVANVLRETLASNVYMPYKGTGANKKLIEDSLIYRTTDDEKIKKAAGKRLVQAALFFKIAPEYVLMQLNAQGANTSVPAIHEQMNALTQGWAEGLKIAVNNLPPELQDEAVILHDKLIKDLNKAGSEFVAKGLPVKLGNKNTTKEVNKKVKKLKENMPPEGYNMVHEGIPYTFKNGKWIPAETTGF